MKKLLASVLFLPFAVFAGETNDLPMLIPAYGEMPPTFLEQYKTLLIIGFFAFLVLAVLIIWKMLQPKSTVVLPSEKIAREALEKLKCQPEDGKTLSAISQVLRRYICSAFNFSSNEITTTEISTLLADDKKIGEEFSQNISNFLHECDERKFSPTNPKAAFGAANRALEIVEQIEKRRAKLSAQISEAK